MIALAWRQLTSMNYVKIQKLEREELEKNLHFLGFVIMENRLKPQTRPVILELQSAAIRTIMVTGKSMLHNHTHHCVQPVAYIPLCSLLLMRLTV